MTRRAGLLLVSSLGAWLAACNNATPPGPGAASSSAASSAAAAASPAAASAVEFGAPGVAPRAVDGGERAEEIAVAPAMAVVAIADFVEIGVERSGSDFVEQRLPDMGAVALDQDDVVMLAAVAGAEPADEFEARGTAANHDDLGLFLAPRLHLYSTVTDLARLRG